MSDRKLTTVDALLRDAFENPKPRVMKASGEVELYHELFSVLYNASVGDDMLSRGEIDDIAHLLNRHGWTLVRREFTPEEIAAKKASEQKFLDMIKKV